MRPLPFIFGLPHTYRMKRLLLLWLLPVSLTSKAQVAPPDPAEARLRWLFDSTRQVRLRRIYHQLDSAKRAQALARGVVLPPAPVLPPIAPTPPLPLRNLYSKGPAAYRTPGRKTASPKPLRIRRKPKE